MFIIHVLHLTTATVFDQSFTLHCICEDEVFFLYYITIGATRKVQEPLYRGG